MLFALVLMVLMAFQSFAKENETCEAEVNRSGKGLLAVENRNRLHPLVSRLGQGSTAMSAKFRSLSSRDLQVWYDDGRGGVEQAYLQPGKESTTNTYIGHSFFVTPENNKNEVLNRFTISADKVFYAVADPGFPGSEEILNKHKKEEEFIQEVLPLQTIPMYIVFVQVRSSLGALLRHRWT